MININDRVYFFTPVPEIPAMGRWAVCITGLIQIRSLACRCVTVPWGLRTARFSILPLPGRKQSRGQIWNQVLGLMIIVIEEPTILWSVKALQQRTIEPVRVLLWNQRVASGAFYFGTLQCLRGGRGKWTWRGQTGVCTGAPVASSYHGSSME